VEKSKVDLPSGEATLVSLTNEEWTQFTNALAELMIKTMEQQQQVPEEAKQSLRDNITQQGLIPMNIEVIKGTPLEPIIGECGTKNVLICQSGKEFLVQEFKNVDLAATIGQQALEEGKKTKIMFFGDIVDEFRPDLNKSGKNFITRVQVFMVEGKGYYGQVYVTTCKKTGGFFNVVENMHPVKIDLELKQFITIEKEHGEKRGFRFQDRLKCENIEKMIDFVVSRIVQEPDATLTPVLGMDQEQDVDDADFWKDKHEDPDWWKKGPPKEGGPGPQEPSGMF